MNPKTKILLSKLFDDDGETNCIKFPTPSFKIYQSEALTSVRLCQEVACNLYPKSLPRPFSINQVQVHAVRLALIQYYKHACWSPSLSVETLLNATYDSRIREEIRVNNYGGGFVIGDGTGIGKTREMAAFIISVVLAESSIKQLAIDSHMDVLTHTSRRNVYGNPFFIWITCSRNLFRDCQNDILQVLVNKDDRFNTWTKVGFADRPSFANTDSDSSLSKDYSIHTHGYDNKKNDR